MGYFEQEFADDSENKNLDLMTDDEIESFWYNMREDNEFEELELGET